MGPLNHRWVPCEGPSIDCLLSNKVKLHQAPSAGVVKQVVGVAMSLLMRNLAGKDFSLPLVSLMKYNL